MNADRPQTRRTGAMLLEVIIAFSIMVFAMAVLGAQLYSGMRTTAQAEEITQAGQLADRMLALVELEPNTVQQFFEQKEMDGDFDEQYPGWFWRATVEPLSDNDDEQLGMVTIEILHQTDSEQRDSIDGARIVRTLHMLKANPAKIDLAKDFGVPEEQLEMLASFIPIEGFDPKALDPQALVSLDPETLMGLLPVLLPLLQQFQLGGVNLPNNISPEMLSQLAGGNLGDLSSLLATMGGGGGGGLPAIPGLAGGAGGGGGGDLGAIRELIKSTLGDQLSDEELSQLLSSIGPGGGGGQGIRNLDAQRDAENARYNRFRGGGKGR